MTYRELMAALTELNDEQLDSDVSVFDVSSEEYWPATGFGLTDGGADVLDPYHPIISF